MADNCLIEKFRIHYFKSIVDQEIHLGLVNVFIGANGSGKSNVLEALGVLSAAASGRVDDESLRHRGVRPGVPRLYKSAFEQRISPHISFEAYAQDASYSVSLNNPLESPRPAWLFKTEDLRSINHRLPVASRSPRTARNVEQGIEAINSPRTAKNVEQGIAALRIAELEESDPAVCLLNNLRDYAIYAPNTLMLRGLTVDPQTREPVGLAGGSLPEAVRQLKNMARRDEFLAEALEELLELIDWIEAFGVTVSAESMMSSSVPRARFVLSFRDRYMREGKNTLSAHDASEGALYVLFCAVLALLPSSPKCLSVDNLDQALNPRLSQKLVGSLCRWITENPIPRQILFTAHNPAVLDGLPLDDDRIRLFAVDRNSKGHTVINQIAITDDLRLLSEKNGWPLSRLWLMGHLGGVPNV